MTSRSELPIGRVLVIGTGLIGCSIGLALRKVGIFVTGTDADTSIAAQALAMGAIDKLGDDLTAELIAIATPHESVAELATRYLADPKRSEHLVVTDVSGIKTHVVSEINHPRFVGGHPMAGSEQNGPEGAAAELFENAVWVLTPTADTNIEAFSLVQEIISLMGADVLVLSPADHDRLVAVVSHVPHLVAASLVTTATSMADQDAVLLRLAAGGFRDMTRIAAGDADIWPDVLCRNATAVAEALDAVISVLQKTKDQITSLDREAIFSMLNTASDARRRLPERAARPDALGEIRIPVPDRQGVLAQITAEANDRGVNIYDIEIAHAAEDVRGVLSLIVALEDAEQLVRALKDRGFDARWHSLGQSS